MRPIVLFATSERGHWFFSGLGDLLRASERFSVLVTRHFSANTEITLQECTGRKFAFVSIAGSADEIRNGVEILNAAVTKCPAGVLVDEPGYAHCHRLSGFPHTRVRFIFNDDIPGFPDFSTMLCAGGIRRRVSDLGVRPEILGDIERVSGAGFSF